MNSRRVFLRNVIGSAAAVAVVGAGRSLVSAQDKNTPPATSAPPRPAPIAAARVEEFVRAAHSDLPQTQKLLEADPTLINATWDWGGGDFETALGGASHMGRPDIALFLLESGARLDLFAAAMLGLTPVVKHALEKYPAFLNTPGPHGIPLLAHAKAGGEPAKEVRQYLEGLAGQKTAAQSP